jgi:hypothetical protein
MLLLGRVSSPVYYGTLGTDTEDTNMKEGLQMEKKQEWCVDRQLEMWKKD